MRETFTWVIAPLNRFLPEVHVNVRVNERFNTVSRYLSVEISRNEPI